MLTYIDPLITARRNREISDHIHLGLFKPDRNCLDLSKAQDAMSLYHIRQIALVPEQTIIDVGCGFGGTIRILDDQLQSLNLYGVNIDKRQLELAESLKLQNKTIWLNCDAAAFSQNKYAWADCILSIEALFHFPDPLAFFKASAQALRKKSHLVLSTLIFEKTGSNFQRSIKCVCDGYAPWPFPELSADNILKIAIDSGFRLTHYEDLAEHCLPSLEWMSPECPKVFTNTPVIEFRRLFEAEIVSYPFFVFEKI
jgi:MPBQ/MSBQ methyltransferase